jgi:hypothetical protein
MFLKQKVTWENQTRLLKIFELKITEEIPYKFPVDATHVSDNYVFLEWTPALLASQLTARTAYKMWKLHPKEFFDQAWQKKNRETLAPYICAMTDLWNDISAWVSTSIVLSWPGIKVTRVIAYFITLAAALEDLRNYHSLTAVLSGLGNVAVTRLQLFWQQIPRHQLDIYQRLAPLRDPSMSFKNYRENLKTVKPKSNLTYSNGFTENINNLSFIPFPVVHLSDITFINLGNSEYLEDGTINWRRCRYLGTSIAQVLSFQFYPPYSIETIDDIQVYISNLRKGVLNDKELYSLSRTIKQNEKYSLIRFITGPKRNDRRQRVKRHSALENKLSDEDFLEAEKLNLWYITEGIIASGFPLRQRRNQKTDNPVRNFFK